MDRLYEMTSLFPESPSFNFIEIVACAFLTIVVWFCSLTICFPLLVGLLCSSWLRNKTFAFIFGSAVFRTKRYAILANYRRKLFDLLRENADMGLSSAPLRIVEIGVGGGENFEYYPENHVLTTVDMNPEFGSYLRSSLKKHPNIKLEKVVTARAEDMSVISDNEYDVAVATFLLCSVTDVDTVLNEVHRVLKKGGRFIMIDHVVYPRKYVLAHMIQKLMTPMWRVYFNGCILNRDITKNVMNSLFSEVSIKIYYPSFINLFLRPQLMTICTK